MTAPKTAAELRDAAHSLLEQAALLETPVTAADLKTMSPDQIETARLTGRLDSLLGRK